MLVPYSAAAAEPGLSWAVAVPTALLIGQDTNTLQPCYNAPGYSAVLVIMLAHQWTPISGKNYIITEIKSIITWRS